MFKLILVTILFLIFVLNYFYGYFQTIPYFINTGKNNIYQYLIDKIDTKQFSGYIIKTAINDSGYVLDYSGAILFTNFNYFAKDGDKFKILVPIFIANTGNNFILSGDKIFDNLNYKVDFKSYEQIFSGGNNYIYIGKIIDADGKLKDNNIFLGKFYLYCTLSNIGWVNSYLYENYIKYNKNYNIVLTKKVDNQYICGEDRELTYKKTICDGTKCTENTYKYCTCIKRNDYWLCENLSNPDKKTCNDDNKCLEYYKGTINLKNTNCSIDKIKDFIIRY